MLNSIAKDRMGYIKLEYRNPKFTQWNPPQEGRLRRHSTGQVRISNDQNSRLFRTFEFMISILFRISCFGFRIFYRQR